MNLRKEMSQQQSDKAPVTFRDVAAYFSEEEWKLIHDWQKELYKNVLKEIHQAIILMGYKIVNPNIFFRINTWEKEPTWDAERQAENNDPISSCYSAVSPDILLRIKQEEEPYCTDSEAVEITHTPITGELIANSDILFTKNRKEKQYMKDLQETDRRDGNGRLSRDHSIITSICQFSIKEEEETDCENYPCSERREGTDSPIYEEDEYQEEQGHEQRTTGKGSRSRKKQYEECVSFEKTSPFKSSCGKATAKVLQSSEKGIHYMSQASPECNQELEAETTTVCKSSFSNLSRSSLQFQFETSKLQGSEKQNENKSNMSNANIPCQRKAQQHCRPFTCTKCDKTFNHKGHFIAHQLTHTKERPFACKECVKSFSLKGNLIAHQKTHSGVRPYQCTECEKSFNHKGNCIAHQRIHTRERPFTCNDCNESFSWKRHFVKHLKTHTGGKPYKCTVCEKSFRHNSYLIRHQRTHSGERPYQCAECGKQFSHKGNLSIHQRTHTGEKPYQCAQCNKYFSYKGDCKKHQRTHMGDRVYLCTKCEERFTQKRDLIIHQRTHMGKMTYPCIECEKSFSHMALLVRHKRTHTGEKPYPCNECEKRFSQKGNLSEHKKTHRKGPQRSHVDPLETR